MAHLLGIEIGGTKLQLAVGSGDGTEFVATARLVARASEGAAAIRTQIETAIPGLIGKAGLSHDQVAAVGVGFGGPVNADLATVAKSHQVGGWEEFPLAQWLNGRFGWPVSVQNDADTAALAEARFGAGRGYDPVFYITIGSGIGGGLVLGGKVYRGCGAGASELGHLRVPDPVPCPAGPYDKTAVWVTAESICSGWSIGRRAREAIAADQPSRMAELAAMRGEECNARIVAAAAKKGDPVAKRLLQQTWRVLAVPIAQMITLLCPQRVVIGGGVSAMGESLLLEPLRREVRRLVFAPFADLYEIVPAALGQDVVLHGALALALAREAACRLHR